MCRWSVFQGQGSRKDRCAGKSEHNKHKQLLTKMDAGTCNYDLKPNISMISINCTAGVNKFIGHQMVFDIYDLFNILIRLLAIQTNCRHYADGLLISIYLSK